jgi:anti-sigma-K factor RskA
MARPEDYDYRLDIPDYVLGVADKDVSLKIEALMAENPLFKAEVEAMRSTLLMLDEHKAQDSLTLKADMPIGYFEQLSENIMAKVHEKPRHQKFWDELKLMAREWFSPVPVAEFSSALAGIALLIMVFSFMFQFQTDSPDYSSRISQQDIISYETHTLLATLEFTNGNFVVSDIYSLSYDEAENMLDQLSSSNTILPELLNNGQNYNVLSADEAYELLKYL